MRCGKSSGGDNDRAGSSSARVFDPEREFRGEEIDQEERGRARWGGKDNLYEGRGIEGDLSVCLSVCAPVSL